MSTVSMMRCPDYRSDHVEQALDAALEPFGGLNGVAGFGRRIKRGSRILIKPNFLRAAPAEAVLSPHPELLRALIARLQSLDLNLDLRIGDSPAFGTARGVARANGIAAVAAQAQVPIIEFRRPTKVWVPGFEAGPLQIDTAVLEADVVINVCKMKSHCQMLMTGAVKNLFGCISGKRKPIWHMRLGDQENRFAELMLAIYQQVGPVISICDAVLAMEGNGPGLGDPRQVGLLLVAEDAVALDTILAELAGYQPEQLRILQAARAANIGASCLEAIQLHGDVSLEDARVLHWKGPDMMNIAFSPLQVLRSSLKQIALRSSALLKPESV
ncbi:MAG: (4Fe-4S)-binding protein [Rickettsiales bacterium]|nr:(4Fe-4S)-binding protein [Rickettsiales bacterium]